MSEDTIRSRILMVLTINPGLGQFSAVPEIARQERAPQEEVWRVLGRMLSSGEITRQGELLTLSPR